MGRCQTLERSKRVLQELEAAVLNSPQRSSVDASGMGRAHVCFLPVCSFYAKIRDPVVNQLPITLYFGQLSEQLSSNVQSFETRTLGSRMVNKLAPASLPFSTTPGTYSQVSSAPVSS